MKFVQILVASIALISASVIAAPTDDEYSNVNYESCGDNSLIQVFKLGMKGFPPKNNVKFLPLLVSGLSKVPITAGAKIKTEAKIGDLTINEDIDICEELKKSSQDVNCPIGAGVPFVMHLNAALETGNFKIPPFVTIKLTAKGFAAGGSSSLFCLATSFKFSPS